jgi:hypothetical protein
MHWTLPASSAFFQLGDVSTGEPQLYCSGSLTNRQYLSRLERDPQHLRLRTAIAVHLPRRTLIACSAAVVLLGMVAAAKAEGPARIPSAGQATAECAARDLQVVSFIEQRGETGDLPAARLGELGLMQLEARRTCIAGDEPKALAIYDDVLSAGRLAERARP